MSKATINAEFRSAVVNENLEKMESLLSKGADPKNKDAEGLDAVQRAAFQGSIKALKYLGKERYIDVESVDNYGNSLAILAAISPNLEILDYLVEEHALRLDSNFISKFNGFDRSTDEKGLSYEIVINYARNQNNNSPDYTSFNSLLKALAKEGITEKSFISQTEELIENGANKDELRKLISVKYPILINHNLQKLTKYLDENELLPDLKSQNQLIRYCVYNQKNDFLNFALDQNLLKIANDVSNLSFLRKKALEKGDQELLGIAKNKIENLRPTLSSEEIANNCLPLAAEIDQWGIKPEAKIYYSFDKYPLHPSGIDFRTLSKSEIKKARLAIRSISNQLKIPLEEIKLTPSDFEEMSRYQSSKNILYFGINSDQRCRYVAGSLSISRSADDQTDHKVLMICDTKKFFAKDAYLMVHELGHAIGDLDHPWSYGLPNNGRLPEECQFLTTEDTAMSYVTNKPYGENKFRESDAKAINDHFIKNYPHLQNLNPAAEAKPVADLNPTADLSNQATENTIFYGVAILATCAALYLAKKLLTPNKSASNPKSKNLNEGAKSRHHKH